MIGWHLVSITWLYQAALVQFLTVFAYAHSGPQGEALKPLETFIFFLIL